MNGDITICRCQDEMGYMTALQFDLQAYSLIPFVQAVVVFWDEKIVFFQFNCILLLKSDDFKNEMDESDARAFQKCLYVSATGIKNESFLKPHKY